MHQTPADFFLGSWDNRGDFARPRACWLVARLQMENGPECVLVEINPPVIGQPYGLGDKDLTTLILTPRWKGTHFEKSFYPMPVLIYRILKAIDDRIVRLPDVRMEAWGEVYPTLEGAEHASDPSSVLALSQRHKQ